MKVSLHPCFILHRRNYRESSLLLDVFSVDHGRVGLIAKGIKRKRSNQAGILQPYQRLQIAWSGKGELMTLTDAEPDREMYLLKNKNLIAAFYLNELIIRLLHQHEAHPDLFSAYDETLGKLSDSSEGEPALRSFEKRLLQSIGYALVLDHDVQTNENIREENTYYYLADRGPMLVTPDTSDCIRVSGQTLLAVNNDKLVEKDILYEAKCLMRYVLQKHLGKKPLSSRQLYQSYLSNLNS